MKDLLVYAVLALAMVGLAIGALSDLGWTDHASELAKGAKYAQIVATHEKATAHSDLVLELVASYIEDADAVALDHLLDELATFLQHYSELIGHIDDYQSLVDANPTSNDRAAQRHPWIASASFVLVASTEQGELVAEFESKDAILLIEELEVARLNDLADQLRDEVNALVNFDKVVSGVRDVLAQVRVLQQGEKLALELPAEKAIAQEVARIAEGIPAVRRMLDRAYSDFAKTRDEAIVALQAQLSQMSSTSQMKVVEIHSLMARCNEQLQLITNALKQADSQRDLISQPTLATASP
jgi:hypothetical protein